MDDFDDVLVVSVAKSGQIDILITQNEKDFEQSGLVIYSPDEFLDCLKNSTSY